MDWMLGYLERLEEAVRQRTAAGQPLVVGGQLVMDSSR
jgi:hypothetical protein